jgi:hypothetical protein
MEIPAPSTAPATARINYHFINGLWVCNGCNIETTSWALHNLPPPVTKIMVLPEQRHFA